jgi:hypothetical protein
MGHFLKFTLDDAKHAIMRKMSEVTTPYNDGWTASSCKHDLYKLKCWLDEEYAKLPTFVGEEEWEKERVFDLLKKD